MFGARAREVLGLAVLAVATAVAIYLAPPEAWTDINAPTTGALYGFLLSLIALGAARAMGSIRVERAVLAAFLASMPLVYIGGALRGGGDGLVVELVGLAVFGAIAYLGLRRPMLIAAGIALHGIGWDLWHVAHPGAVPEWYGWACMVIDIGVAAYAVSRADR